MRRQQTRLSKPKGSLSPTERKGQPTILKPVNSEGSVVDPRALAAMMDQYRKALIALVGSLDNKDLTVTWTGPEPARQRLERAFERARELV